MTTTTKRGMASTPIRADRIKSLKIIQKDQKDRKDGQKRRYIK